MKKANLKNLINVYHALTGIASEMGAEFFDAYYQGGDGEKLFTDLEEILRGEGVVIDEPEYCVRSYNDKTAGEVRWGIASNPTGKPDWCLTGFKTSREAADELANPAIFGEDAVKVPRILDDVGIGLSF